MTPDPDILELYRAHLDGDLDTIRKLLAARPELEKRAHNPPWVFEACDSGHIAIVDFWIDRMVASGEIVDLTKELGRLLFSSGSADLTRHLLRRGAPVDVHMGRSGTPLHSAVVRAVEASQKGRRRETPPEVAEQIRVLLEAGVDPAVADNEGTTPLGLAIRYKRRTAEKVLREAGAPEKAPRAKPKKKVELDLDREFQEMLAYIAERAKSFDPTVGDGLGGAGPVAMIVAGFEFQAGWLVLAFDTRADAELDGEWDRHLDKHMLPRDRWLELGEANLDAPVTIVGLDGAKKTLRTGADLAKTFGKLVQAAMLRARDDGALARLPLAKKCKLTVTHFSGDFDWQTTLKPH